MTTPEATNSGNTGHPMRKTWISIIFVVLTAVAAQGATGAVWINRTLLDTDRFMDLVEPVIGSEEFATSAADVVAAKAIEALDLKTRVENTLQAINDYLSGLVGSLGIDSDGPLGSLLPDVPDLTILAAPLTNGVETRVANVVNDVFDNAEFRQSVDTALRLSHRVAVAVLTEDDSALPDSVSVNGDVVINLRPMIANAVVSVAAAGADLVGTDFPNISPSDSPESILSDVFANRGIEVPDDFGYVTVLSAEQLEPYRGAVATLGRLQWVMILLTFALLAAAIWTNPDRLAGAVWAGIGIIIVHLIDWPVSTRLLEAVGGNGAGQSLIESVVGEAARYLRELALIVILLAAVLTVVSLTITARQARDENQASTT
jgi:hypothetical protein